MFLNRIIKNFKEGIQGNWTLPRLINNIKSIFMYSIGKFIILLLYSTKILDFSLLEYC